VSDSGRFCGALFGAPLRCADGSDRSAASPVRTDRGRATVVCGLMATGRRIPREKATAALTALLETVCAGGPHADCVTAVYVFGSYARGALTVGDVDTDIEYDARLDPGVEREMPDSARVAAMRACRRAPPRLQRDRGRGVGEPRELAREPDFEPGAPRPPHRPHRTPNGPSPRPRERERHAGRPGLPPFRCRPSGGGCRRAR
jgi:hypothetical protein